MTEAKIIELLSFESEKMFEDPREPYPMFDTEISAWKESKSNFNCSSPKKNEEVRVRIRTVVSRGSLTRNSSSKFLYRHF